MSAETSTVARRDSRVPTSPEGMNRVLWAALSTIGVLLAGVVLLIAIALLSWATDRPDGATAGSAAQVGLQAWYLAHSVALPASWGELSVPPLLVTGYLVLLFYRSGRGAVRSCAIRTPLEIAETLAAVAVTYITCTLLLSSVAYPSPPLLSVWQIIVGAGVLSVGASLAGILRETGHGARLVAMLPGPSYAYTRGALAAFWALAAMSAVAVVVSLLLGFSEASAVTAALAPDGLGGLSIVGISIAFVPNAMLLATALGSGAGFTLGEGSLYSLGTVDREALPLLPLFAALPQDGAGLTLLVVLVPLVAAAVGALTMTRHLEPEHRTASTLVAGSLMTSLLTAVGVLVIALFAAGGLGDGRLAEVGAAPWRLAFRLFLVLGIAIMAVAYLATRRSLKPVSVARREKALSVLETGASKKTGATPKTGATTKKAVPTTKKDAAPGRERSGKPSDDAASKSGEAKTAAVGKAAASKQAAAKNDAASTKTAPKKTTATKSASTKAALDKAGSAKATPANTGSAKATSANTDSDKAGSDKSGSSEAASSKASSTKAVPEGEHGEGSDSAKKAPAASLSVVKRAREGKQPAVEPASARTEPAAGDTKNADQPDE